MRPIVTIIILTDNEYFCFPIPYRDVSECEKSVSDSLDTSLMINKGPMPRPRLKRNALLRNTKEELLETTVLYNFSCAPLTSVMIPILIMAREKRKEF